MQMVWYQRQRALCFTLYVADMGIVLPALFMVWPPASYGLWATATSFAALFIGLVIAVIAPLEMPSAGNCRSACDRTFFYHFLVRAQEEYYTGSQWRMLRRVWLAYAGTAMLCPMLCSTNDALVATALAAPILGGICSSIAVCHEFPAGPLRRSLCLQLCWLSALIFSVLCAAAGRRDAAREWASHFGMLAGIPWSAATLVFAPKLFRQMAHQIIQPHTATVGPGLTTENTPSSRLHRWRRRRLSCGLFATRVGVVWVLVPLFSEAALRKPAPSVVLGVPPIILGIFAVVAIWGSYFRSPQRVCRRQVVVGP